MKKLLLFFVLLLTCPILISQGVEGAKDHPMFPGIDKFKIYDYDVKNFAGYRFCNEDGEDIKVEGMHTFIYYEYEGEVDPTMIISKIGTIVKELGGKFYGDDPHRRWAEIHTSGKVVWAELYAEDFYYTLNVIEKGEILSEITADGFLSDLRDKGKTTIYLNFEDGECELREECKKVVNLIAEALKTDPSIDILLEGYTDDFGRLADNLLLSANRASALANALIESGIASERMESVGRGEENPVASNETIEGRALNNRIEITRKK